MLTKESPLVAEVLLGLNLLSLGIGVGWGILKVVEKIRDIQIKGQQLESLRLENDARKRELAGSIQDVSINFPNDALSPRDGQELERLLTEDAARLAGNRNVRIVKVEVVEYR